MSVSAASCGSRVAPMRDTSLLSIATSKSGSLSCQYRPANQVFLYVNPLLLRRLLQAAELGLLFHIDSISRALRLGIVQSKASSQAHASKLCDFAGLLVTLLLKLL